MRFMMVDSSDDDDDDEEEEEEDVHQGGDSFGSNRMQPHGSWVSSWNHFSTREFQKNIKTPIRLNHNTSKKLTKIISRKS